MSDDNDSNSDQKWAGGFVTLPPMSPESKRLYDKIQDLEAKLKIATDALKEVLEPFDISLNSSQATIDSYINGLALKRKIAAEAIRVLSWKSDKA